MSVKNAYHTPRWYARKIDGLTLKRLNYEMSNIKNKKEI